MDPTANPYVTAPPASSWSGPFPEERNESQRAEREIRPEFRANFAAFMQNSGQSPIRRLVIGSTPSVGDNLPRPISVQREFCVLL